LASRIPVGLSRASQGRRFGLTVGVAFLALTALLVWRDHRTAYLVTGGLGAALIFGALVAPTALLPVEKAWMAMAHAISKITTPIFMGIVFFLVVAPIGLVMRALGKNPLIHGERDGGFWVVKAEDRAGRGGMENQF
jgi:hypothetical protein